MISILFLSAEPTDTARLRLGEELREIQEKLQMSRLRDRFVLYERMAVRTPDLTQAILDVRPQIVHFSGHGMANGALCLEDNVGKVKPVAPDALADLFAQFSHQITCVVLNACYSEPQANAIAKHINYVIGMRQPISDQAAIAFSIGFYQALGAGLTPEQAYRLGCTQIRLQGISEHQTPVLIQEKSIHLPTRAQSKMPKIRHNLPQPNYSQFIGRSQEQETIHRLLLPTSYGSVIAIEGIGGTGKSSLALEVAYHYVRNVLALPESERFDAIIWTSAQEDILTSHGIIQRQRPLRTLSDIFITISITLEREDIIRASLDEQFEIVRKAVTRQRTLLIVDNLEAAIERDSIMQFLREIPPPTKVIVTTREAVESSAVIRLHGMTEEDAQQLIREESKNKAVTLSRKEALELGTYTGGVPLAIVWSVAQIAYGYETQSVLSKLSDATSDIVAFCLNTAISQISGTKAYEILQALSLFTRDASKEALEYVVGTGNTASIDNELFALLRLFLASKVNNRFLTLPLVKRAVFANIDEKTNNLLHERIIEYYLSMLKRCLGDDFNGDRVDLYPEIDAELANLTPIMEWCYANKKWSYVLDFVHVLTGGYYGSYLINRGFYNEQVFWIDRAAHAYSEMPEELRKANAWKMVMLYNSGCWVHALRDELEIALEQANNAVSLSEISGDRVGRAIAFRQAGYVFLCLNALDKAESFFNKAFQIWTQLENQIQIASMYTNLAHLSIKQGDYSKAETLYRTAIDSLRALGDYSHRMISAFLGMGDLLRSLNRAEEAKIYLREGLELSQKISHVRGEAQCKLALAKTLLVSGEMAESYTLIVDAYETFERLGMRKEAEEARKLVSDNTYPQDAG